MNKSLLNAANQYAGGLAKVLKRRDKWQIKYKEVRETLNAIAASLNEHSAYKAGYFVDTNHAYNEEINGTCEKMPALTFRCSEMPLYVSFRNAAGERKEYMEHGFQIAFTPTVTGQILVLLQPHYTSLSPERPDYINLAIIDDAEKLARNDIEEIIAKGIDAAFYSSFTGIVELKEKEIQEAQKQQYSPIGFKKYETTEKSD